MDLTEICPKCKEEANSLCKCMLSCRFCKNGHTWLTCDTCRQTTVRKETAGHLTCKNGCGYRKHTLEIRAKKTVKKFKEKPLPTIIKRVLLVDQTEEQAQEIMGQFFQLSSFYNQTEKEVIPRMICIYQVNDILYVIETGNEPNEDNYDLLMLIGNRTEEEWKTLYPNVPQIIYPICGPSKIVADYLVGRLNEL